MASEFKPSVVHRLQVMRPAISPITKIAHEVYRNLGSGFSEDVYDRAMQVTEDSWVKLYRAF
jgi:PD-(D/E)XK nuclease superfamily